jgi:TolA-binding protein
MRPVIRCTLLVALAAAAFSAPAAAQLGRLRRAAAGPSPEVTALLNRIDTTRTLFDRATSLLLKSSYVMEAVVATEDRRVQIRRELASVDSLEQRGGQNRVQLDAQDRATRLEQATAQRQFEGRQLSDAQRRNVGSAVYNAGLAAIIDGFAVGEAQQIIGDAQRVAQSIAGDPAQAAYANRLRQAATVDLPAIVAAGPQQLRLAAAINAAYQQARASGQPIQVTEATARSDPPRPIDINAI